MPELPEVQTIVNDLNQHLSGKTIRAIKVYAAKSVAPSVFAKATADKSAKKFQQLLLNKKVKSVNRLAKMIVFDLGSLIMLGHLKMTGQMILFDKNKIFAGGHPLKESPNDLPNKFTRCEFDFSGLSAVASGPTARRAAKADSTKLYFNDMRRFGWLKVLTLPEFKKVKDKSGIEPLSKDFTLATFKNILIHKAKSTIKQTLLEQKYLVGIGNIYADEALFAARIKPQRRVKTLTDTEIKKLQLAIVRILKLAVAKNGTTFRDYVNGYGRQGGFAKYLKVYGRGGQKCVVCHQTLHKTKVGGRGTVYCENCQK